ncbi:MAG: hypothetical protein COA78_11150 [Blastopirellula sp.]|nr:MAG: hypothetical protein COA78_11150 [Blastopirellula sp.]
MQPIRTKQLQFETHIETVKPKGKSVEMIDSNKWEISAYVAMSSLKFEGRNTEELQEIERNMMRLKLRFKLLLHDYN